LYEDQKRSLESVLGVVVIEDERPAYMPDHRPMTLHQGGKRHLGFGSVRLTIPRTESFEQLPIRTADQSAAAIERAQIPE
jgi:hypothetical protein